jgi:hypothetical protein
MCLHTAGLYISYARISLRLELHTEFTALWVKTPWQSLLGKFFLAKSSWQSLLLVLSLMHVQNLMPDQLTSLGLHTTFIRLHLANTLSNRMHQSSPPEADVPTQCLLQCLLLNIPPCCRPAGLQPFLV